MKFSRFWSLVFLPLAFLALLLPSPSLGSRPMVVGTPAHVTGRLIRVEWEGNNYLWLLLEADEGDTVGVWGPHSSYTVDVSLLTVGTRVEIIGTWTSMEGDVFIGSATVRAPRPGPGRGGPAALPGGSLRGDESDPTLFMERLWDGAAIWRLLAGANPEYQARALSRYPEYLEASAKITTEFDRHRFETEVVPDMMRRWATDRDAVLGRVFSVALPARMDEYDFGTGSYSARVGRAAVPTSIGSASSAGHNGWDPGDQPSGGHVNFLFPYAAYPKHLGLSARLWSDWPGHSSKNDICLRWPMDAATAERLDLAGRDASVEIAFRFLKAPAPYADDFSDLRGCYIKIAAARIRCGGETSPWVFSGSDHALPESAVPQANPNLVGLVRECRVIRDNPEAILAVDAWDPTRGTPLRPDSTFRCLIDSTTILNDKVGHLFPPGYASALTPQERIDAITRNLPQIFCPGRRVGLETTPVDGPVTMRARKIFLDYNDDVEVGGHRGELEGSILTVGASGGESTTVPVSIAVTRRSAVRSLPADSIVVVYVNMHNTRLFDRKGHCVSPPSDRQSLTWFYLEKRFNEAIAEQMLPNRKVVVYFSYPRKGPGLQASEVYLFDR